MPNEDSKGTDPPQIHTVSRTPRRICSFVLSKPYAGSSEGIVAYESNHSSSNLEAAFVRQNLMKNRKLSSFMSMHSNNSGRSLATAASSTNNTNKSNSTTESHSIKRSSSFSSVTRNNSLTSLQQSRASTKTPFHRPAASLAMSTNPQMATRMKIAFQQYLVVPTSDGSVLFYQVIDFSHAEACMQEYELNRNLFSRNDSYHQNIDNQRKMAAKIQQEKEAVPPVFSLGPFHAGDYLNRSLRNITDKLQLIPASIVDICICEVDEMKQTPLLGTIVILVQEGDVHVFDIFSMQNMSPGVEDIPEVKVDHVHSFYSGDIGATSLAAQRALKRTTVDIQNTTLRHHQPELRISVGYEGGTVVEFAIVEKRHLFKWKGRLENSVRSLAYIHAPNEDDIANDRPRPQGKDMVIGPPLDEDLLLVIGTSQYGVDATNPSTTEDIISSCLDVIHVFDAEKEWNSNYRDSSRKESSVAIELVELSIWPTNQIKGEDAVVVSLFDQKKRKSLECPGVKAVSSIDVYKKGHQAFTALLTNGTIVTMYYERNKSRRLGWGLKGKNDQIAMPFPSCGIGLVNFEEEGKCVHSLACCLRSGSTMTIPTRSSSFPSPSKEAVVHCLPFDVDDDFDDNVHYVQGFAAGNIRPRTWGNKSIAAHSMLIPCFFQAWPGGVIECYAYSVPIVTHSTNDRNGQLYRELHSNGALEDIINLLSLDHGHLRPESVLRRASEDYKLRIQSGEELVERIVEGNVEGLGTIKLLLERFVKGAEIL